MFLYEVDLMKYSAEYRNAYVEFIEDDNFGCSNFRYKDNDVLVLCEGYSLYDIIQDFVEMVDEIIEIIDNTEEKN